MGKKRMAWKRAFTLGGILTLAVVLLCHSTAYALEDNDVVSILVNHEALFESNTIGGNILRYIGWGVTKGLAAVGKAAAGLYDTCFGFVDFTSFPEVGAFIEKWKPVFIALVCLSLLFIGILLCVGWEKKPKIVINLLIAVTVVTSSTWVIKEMNSFISTGVRNGIMEGEGGTSVVYNVVGTNIHDLVYLDQSFGLENLGEKKNAGKVYEKFTEEQFHNISINETVEPDDVSEEAEQIMANGIKSEFYGSSGVKYSLDELYDGVAWTDLLNEYYYRYTVDWGAMWMELLSLAIIYLFMSYKVVRCLYEIVVHQLLAYLYAANLNNNQKILKILDSLKDSYILLLMTTVMIKFYLLACRFITGWDVSGLSKGFILLFLAFAVIDGPNLVQKLTGSDMGASDGMGKMLSLFYGSQMVGGVVRTGMGAAKFGAGAVKGGISKGRELYNKVKEGLNGEGGSGASMEEMEAGMAGSGQEAAGGNGGTKGSPEGNRNMDQDGRQENRMPEGENTDPGQAGPGRQDPEQPGKSPEVMAGMAAEGFGREETGRGRGEDAAGPEERTGAGQEEKEGERPSARLDGRDAMSRGEGKDRMGQIGKGMPDRKDALNGMQAGPGRGDSTHIGDMMDRMEQDVSSSPAGGMGAGRQGEMPGRPLDTGGSIFKGHTGSYDGLEGSADGGRMPSGVEGKKESRGSILEENGNGEP